MPPPPRRSLSPMSPPSPPLPPLPCVRYCLLLASLLPQCMRFVYHGCCSSTLQAQEPRRRRAKGAAGQGMRGRCGVAGAAQVREYRRAARPRKSCSQWSGYRSRRSVDGRPGEGARAAHAHAAPPSRAVSPWRRRPAWRRAWRRSASAAPRAGRRPRPASPARRPGWPAGSPHPRRSADGLGGAQEHVGAKVGVWSERASRIAACTQTCGGQQRV